MGLDVYLYRNKDRALAKRQSEEFEAAQTKLREESFGGKRPHEQTDPAIRAAQEEAELNLAAQYNVDRFGGSNLDERVEAVSAINPDHIFRRGYFRSSYNESGFNSCMRRLGFQTLDQLFDTDGSAYEFTPDWSASLARLSKAIEDWSAYSSRPESRYDVLCIHPNPFGMSADAPRSKEQALSLFVKDHMRRADRNEPAIGRAYSNGQGDFYLDGVKAVAMLPGYADNFLTGRKMPATYIVYERDPSQFDFCKWIADALAIAKETVEYVLAQPDKEAYYFHWSG